MSDPTGSAADITGMVARNPGINMGTSGSMREMDQYADDDWAPHEHHWREHYPSRPYAQADRGYEHYHDAYRYGVNAAAQHRGREWDEVEPDLARGWEGARGASRSTWSDMKDAARDAWDRARGRGRSA